MKGALIAVATVGILTSASWVVEANAQYGAPAPGYAPCASLCPCASLWPFSKICPSSLPSLCSPDLSRSDLWRSSCDLWR